MITYRKAISDDICPAFNSIEDVRFQESETCDAMWATADQIRAMMAAGEFLGEWFYPYFDEMAAKWSEMGGSK